MKTPNWRQTVRVWLLSAESCIRCCVTMRLLVAKVALFDFLLIFDVHGTVHRDTFV